MKRYLILSIVLIVLLLCALPARADGPIAIMRSEASFTFQQSVHFVLEASSANPIVRATLRFRVSDQPATNIASPALSPGRVIKAEHTWDVAGADLPSGAVVSYWWTVEDSSGASADSERRVFTYEDTRFTWKKLSRDEITLSWYRGDNALGRDLLDSAVSAYARLNSEFGVERKPAAIYIYGAFTDLQSGIGESAQEWTGGRAYPEFNVALIGVPPNQLSYGKRAVAHEFTHLIVHRATQNPFGDVPRWLDEGLAMWSEGSLERDYRSALDSAVRKNQLLSLRSLASNFPADSKQATLTYAESYSVVVYIRDTFGRAKIGELLQTFREGNTYDAALQRVLGVTTDQLDERWRVSLGLGGNSDAPGAAPQTQQPAVGIPRSVRTLVAGGLLFGGMIVLLALVLVVALIVRR